MAKLKNLNFNVENLRKYERKVVNTIVVVIAISGLIAAYFGGRTFWEHLLKVPPHALMFLALASLVENVLRIYRYRIFSHALDLPVPWPRLILYYVAGMALLPTPGKAGVLLRLWLLHEHHGIRYRRSAPLLVMDVLTDTIAMAVLIAIGVMSLGHIHGAGIGLFLLTALTVGVLIVLFAPAQAVKLLKGVYLLTGKRAPRLFASLKTMLRLLHKLMGWRVLAVCTMLSFVAWAGFGFALSYLIISMGHPVDWNLGGFALCAGTILGVITMAPAGVGGAEASMIGIFHAFGTPLGIAFIVTMLGRMAVIWIPVGVGFIALPWALASPDDKRPAYLQREDLDENDMPKKRPTRPAPTRAAAKSKRSASRR